MNVLPSRRRLEAETAMSQANSKHYLAIEIGGTKLQLCVGTALSTEFVDLVRTDVDVAAGAQGIIRQIETLGAELLQKHTVAGVGIGFGGPVDVATGRVTTSHQIQGWDGIPLGERLRQRFGVSVQIDNDCNVAALAEATLGAGQGVSRVFYATVGTGIGGGFVVNGKLDGNQRPAIAEIGHLRPGLDAVSHDATVESIASGWGISNSVKHLLQFGATFEPELPADGPVQTLRDLCNGDIDSLTTKQICLAATQGNEIAKAALTRSARTLGWAIAQVVTLLAPEVVVVGGGVSLSGEQFFTPLREAAQAYVFPPLATAYQIGPAQLGEEVVLHGALQIAKQGTD